VTSNGLLTTLASFAGTNGANPETSLALGTDGNYYGTTAYGGGDSFARGGGTVFRVTKNGIITDLHDFHVGVGPFGLVWYVYPNSLTLGNDGAFYSTTYASDSFPGFGTVYRVTTNGALSNLFSFSLTDSGDSPKGGLTPGSDGNLYGTTSSGGSGGGGTVFRVTTNGAFASLVSFGGTNGAYPKAGLTRGSDGSFYGTTSEGGSSSNGTVFRVTASGAFSSLASFGGTNGAYPAAALTLGSDGNLYGTTERGGNGYGTVFQVTTNGSITTLASFTGADGAYPVAALTLGSDGYFYGTASSGGTFGSGVVYRLCRGVSLQSFRMTTNGFQLDTLNAGGSGWVVLESSIDLVHWTSLQTNGTAAKQQFLDTTALTQPSQFYRVRQQ